MKKRMELTSSELWANHLLKSTIKEPSPAKKREKKKNFKKNSQSIHKMKLVQINFIVFGDPYKTKPTTVYKGKSEKTRIEVVASQ